MNGLPLLAGPNRRVRIQRVAVAILALVLAGRAAAAGNRYALILQDSPVAARIASREDLAAAAVAGYRQRIEAAQANVKRELQTRRFVVTGSVTTVLNAVFVAARPDRVTELKSIPGVIGVVALGRSRMLLNRATSIMNGPQAWTILGGLNNAGAGVKIGVLDTGIDQTHPSLQDSSLQIPTGFPKCDTAKNCSDFTTNKVIVARSYVALDGAGSDPANPAADSSPDDFSPRDRVGHGTAVATAAAGNTATLAVTIDGMAPKAWIGNYKVAGSPDVNNGASNDAIIKALDDAVIDGMDVITFSFGGTSTTGPIDTGSICGNLAGVPCDPVAYAFEQAAQKGIVILVAAGNEGMGGPYGTGNYPAWNTISSPADAPSVIAVGAASNTHSFNPDIEVQGSGVPANLHSIPANYTDAFSPSGAYSAPLVDVTQVGDSTGLGCVSLPPSSLLGKIALIERGTCNFSVKMNNAVNAGAIGVIFFDNISESLISPTGLSNFSQPVLIIGLNDGQNLKAYLDSNPGHPVTINPSAVEAGVSNSVVLAGYSSVGPGLGTNGIKPDLLGVGGGSNNGDLIYMGAQSYDPLGALYSSDGYIAAAGTSFATPLAAGAAAMVKQRHPGYTGLQVKSALVNTAAQTVTVDDGGSGTSSLPVNILQTGSGLVASDLALQTNVTIVPSTVSFGSFKAGTALSQNQVLTLTNTGTSSVNLSFAVATTAGASGATVSVIPASLPLAAGASGSITVALNGTVPAGGLYYGAVNVSGASVALHVPYMFLSPFGLAGTVSLDATYGDSNAVIVNQVLPDGEVAFQLTDQNGAPVVGAPVTFTKASKSVPLTLSQMSSVTDNYGFAHAMVTIGPQTGTYAVNATGGGQSYQFSGTVYAQPTISSNGVLDSASGVAPIAPGSYVTIYGSNLSTATDQNYSALHLPLAIDQVTVSFDAPASGSLPALSVPAHLLYVSPGQVNIQVPWELQGYSSAKMKVTIFGFGYGNVVNVPIAKYAPAIFETGNGVAAALDGAYQVISPSNPVARGTYIALYCNGLGPVSNQPPSGDPAQASPLSSMPSLPTVTIGGVAANVVFGGLTPSLPGLYQVNVQVPANIAPGNQPVVVSIGGAASKTSGITVK